MKSKYFVKLFETTDRENAVGKFSDSEIKSKNRIFGVSPESMFSKTDK